MKPKSTFRSFLLLSASLSLAAPALADVVPVSTPGGPYLVLAAGNLTLTGSGAPSDTGTAITTYEWDLDNDGDFDEAVTGATPTAIPYATLTGTYSMVKGSNTIKLRVTDDSSPTPLTTTATTTVILDTTTYTGTSGSAGATDTWNIAGRWNAGIPALTSDAVIAASKYVVANATTPTYSGSLSIGAGSTLQLGWTTVIPTAYNAFGNGNVTMAAGSSITTRNQDPMTFASITLTGNAFIGGGSSTQKGATMNFGAISGAYTLSLYNHNANFQTGNSNLNAANSFSALVLTATDNTSSTVNAKVAGSLGTGDVILNSGKLTFGTAAGAVNIMADTGVLRINGGIAADRVTMTASDTIAGVTLNGAKQLSGTYTSAETWLGGAGTLTVTGATSAYWDIDSATAGAGGTAPTGTWDGTSNWSSASAGNVAAVAWVPGQNAIFAAGTGATGTYAVTVSGTQDVAGFGFEEGNVTLSGDGLRITETAPVIVKTGASAIIQSVISENVGPFGLHKSGPGALSLSGANIYTGGTVITEGTLNINSAGVAGVSGPLGNGGTFAINGGTIDNTSGSAQALLNVNPITLGGDLAFSTGGGTANNNLTLPGSLNLFGGTRTITTNGAGVLTLSGNISNGTLAKSGAGALVLSGTNSHSTTLTGGKLVVVGTSALGTGALTWGTTNTTLQFQNDANLAVTNTLATSNRNTTRTIVVDRITAGAAVNLSFSSAPNLDDGTMLNFTKGANITSGTPTITFSGGVGTTDSNTPSTITLNPTGVDVVINGITSSAKARIRNFQGDSTGNRVTGTFANGSGTAVNKNGTGTWTFACVSQYTGATTITGGTLAFGADNILPNGSTVSIGAGILDAVTFDDTAGTLDVTSTATINLGVGANLAFADSDMIDWTSGTLNVTGTLGATSLRFGTDNTGLTPAQLALISVNGSGLGTYVLDASGYLVAGGGNTPPTITDIANQSVPSGGNTGALVFTVGDAQTAPGALVATASSSNATLVPNANIVIAGNGGIDGSRTVTVTPVSGLVGSAIITVTVTDGGSLTAQDTFTLTVTDNYVSWATLNGVTGGVSGDHDNDGVKNLVEYALVDGGERGVLSGNTITFTKRPAPYGTDLTYDIESSTGLISWSVLAKPPVVETVSAISYTFTPSSPVKNFARLKVVQVP